MPDENQTKVGRLRSACPGSAVSSALLGESRSTRGCGGREHHHPQVPNPCANDRIFLGVYHGVVARLHVDQVLER
eukprot:4903408-Prymnesium_polylepis.1